MHRARAFFYVAAGIFLLALSYHLGARTSHAQSGVIQAPWVGYGIAAIVGRTMYYGDDSGHFYVDGVPVPGTSPVIAIGGQSNPPNQAMLENGDVYYRKWSDHWDYVGNLLGGPTAAKPLSMGQLKTRYR